ncbi:MAG: tetratricopeptide repeat protein, partial [Bacteroidota bacterium]
NGDFEWAQAQLQVLKASTSELIANDAIDLSVFIMDHWSLDTTGTPMAMFAQADLLMFQNRYDESFVKLDSIRLLYPDHGLLDDIYYIKSQILTKERNYEDAAIMLQQIIDGYPEDIRADNAVFDLAELHELHLGNPETAQELYGKILKDYSGSTLAVEARKRFRRLRGDDLQ